MVTENTIQDGVETTPEAAPDPVLTELKAIRENQTKLDNRLGYLQRKIDNTPQGQSIDPALSRQVAEIQRDLAEQRLSSMTDDEQIAYYKKQAEEASKNTPPAAIPLSDGRLKAIVDDFYQAEVVDIINDYCQDAGIDLTPAMKSYLDNQIPLDINRYTGQPDPTSYLKAAQKYLRDQQKAKTEAATKTTPAEEAGATLGDGTRSSGGRGKGMTWAQAQKIKSVNDLTDEEYFAIIKQS